MILFLILAFFLILGLWYKIRRIRQDLDIQYSINYFASFLYTHNEIDEMLWDMTQKCISRLGFEDCVIYKMNEDKTELHQLAAFGPKQADSKSILAPIAIQLGKGIVGTVALNKKSEIIKDTNRDPRYIKDDLWRLSEIAVPILWEEEVLGVIDSEHSQKNFYTEQHLKILEAIAAICAQKIKLITNQKSLIDQMNLIQENQKKMLEWKLQALQNQMDPHFMLNAMNSLQSFVLANDVDRSLGYISNFSKLLNHLFKQSKSAQISLKSELSFVQEYVNMEAIRFNKDVEIIIKEPGNLDLSRAQIPTFILQPIIENSIWHGFMQQSGKCIISFDIRYDEMKNLIFCTIEDNGSRVQDIKNNSTKYPSGQGLNLITERLSTWSELTRTLNKIAYGPKSGEHGFIVDLLLSHIPLKDESTYN